MLRSLSRLATTGHPIALDVASLCTHIMTHYLSFRITYADLDKHFLGISENSLYYKSDGHIVFLKLLATLQTILLFIGNIPYDDHGTFKYFYHHILVPIALLLPLPSKFQYEFPDTDNSFTTSNFYYLNLLLQ